VAVDADSSYRYLGTGAQLALEVSGPTLESCLARAVEGLTSSFADVHPSVAGRPRRVLVDGSEPAWLLRGVLDAAVGIHTDGELAVTLAGARRGDDELSADLEVVPLHAARLVNGLPHALVWHDVRLDRTDGHWVGRVVADLTRNGVRPNP
jgi:SHS2 domain-containing protein